MWSSNSPMLCCIARKRRASGPCVAHWLHSPYKALSRSLPADSRVVKVPHYRASNARMHKGRPEVYREICQQALAEYLSSADVSMIIANTETKCRPLTGAIQTPSTPDRF